MNQLELSELFEYTDVYHRITTQDNNAVITIDSCAGYDHIITLINATGIPESEYDYIYFKECTYINELNKYHLTGETARFTDDTEEVFEIEFDDAIADVKVYKAQALIFSDTPWQHLQDIAITIFNKYSLSADCLNTKEQECFPIILELCKLSYRIVLPKEYDTPYFPELKKYITKYNYPKLLALTEKLETHYYDDKKSNKLAHKLLAKLNSQRYEPMWRELHDILEASQSEYPTNLSVLYPREESERKLLQPDAPMWLMFLLFFVFMGGLFGIFMTVGLMAISIVIALVFGQPYAIPSMITDIPWWKCLAFCWIAFGGIMGFITILSKRK